MTTARLTQPPTTTQDAMTTSPTASPRERFKEYARQAQAKVQAADADVEAAKQALADAERTLETSMAGWRRFWGPRGRDVRAVSAARRALSHAEHVALSADWLAACAEIRANRW